MKLSFDRDLTEQEKTILYDKIKSIPFKDYYFNFENKNPVGLYSKNIYQNNSLEILFGFVSREVKLDKNRTYHEKGMKSVINKYALKDKQSLFRIQALAAVLGNGRAACDIGTIFRTNNEKEAALKWYKKALVLGEHDDAVKGILRMSIYKNVHMYGVI